MTLLDGLNAGPRRPSRPVAARGRVSKAPAGVDQELEVVLINYSNVYSYQVPGTNWVARGSTLPVKGDGCVVVFDDDGDAWVPVWEGVTSFASGGGGVTQEELDSALTLKQDLATAATDAELSAHVATQPAHGGDLAGTARPPTAHTHDDRYYTETETNGLLAAKQDAATAATDAELATGLAAKADTARGLPSGGADGLVLTKQSATDYDVAWEVVAGGGGGTVFSTGTYAARPAATVVAAGTLYRATDKWMTWVSDGATWTLIAADPQPLAAIPASPIDGQRISLPWGNARAVFRYNDGSASTMKWECEGAPPWESVIANNQLTLSATTAWQVIASPTTLVIPWSGDYATRVQGTLYIAGGSGHSISYGVGTTTTPKSQLIVVNSNDPSGNGFAATGEGALNWTAGDSLRPWAAQSFAGSGATNWRQMSLVPIRVA